MTSGSTNAILKRALAPFVIVIFNRKDAGLFLLFVFVFHEAQCTDGIIGTENFDDQFIFPRQALWLQIIRFIKSALFTRRLEARDLLEWALQEYDSERSRGRWEERVLVTKIMR